MKQALAAGTVVALVYDVLVRPRMLYWGATDEDRRGMQVSSSSNAHSERRGCDAMNRSAMRRKS
jgi:hypothetical protein